MFGTDFGNARTRTGDDSEWRNALDFPGIFSIAAVRADQAISCLAGCLCIWLLGAPLLGYPPPMARSFHQHSGCDFVAA